MLRYDIDKFKDAEGLTWTKQFSIYDEADAQSLVKEIVTQELQLDPKRIDPKKTRWAIAMPKTRLAPGNRRSARQAHRRCLPALPQGTCC